MLANANLDFEADSSTSVWAPVIKCIYKPILSVLCDNISMRMTDYLVHIVEYDPDY